MIGSLARRLRLWREQRVLERRPIPDPLWQFTVARLPFLTARSPGDLARLRELATLFLADKEFTGAHGLEVGDEMAASIAAQACLPVLELGLAWYDGFRGIVVHPDAALVRREVTDDDGIVHAYDDEIHGEAVPGGPMMLSWRHVDEAGGMEPWAYNVVIHEFAHVIDMRDGLSDGIPPLPSRIERDHWSKVIDAGHQRFCRLLDAGRETVLDPYGSESVDEFFAVASEAFFVASEDFADEHPAVYELLAGFYRQDPAARMKTGA